MKFRSKVGVHSHGHSLGYHKPLPSAGLEFPMCYQPKKAETCLVADGAETAQGLELGGGHRLAEGPFPSLGPKVERRQGKTPLVRETTCRMPWRRNGHKRRTGARRKRNQTHTSPKTDACAWGCCLLWRIFDNIHGIVFFLRTITCFAIRCVCKINSLYAEFTSVSC